MRSSSAVVLNDVMYNIGGDGSTHSVEWYRLNAPPNWKFMELRSNYDFRGFWFREALVLENKIVYFG